MSDNKTPETEDVENEAVDQPVEAEVAAETDQTEAADQTESCEAVQDDIDSQVETLQNELITAKEDVIRAQAEMANVRRRAEKDVENARRYSIEKVAKDILPVVDNLERALAAAGEEKTPVTEGVELTLKSLLSTLEKNKIEAINPSGEPFDPELHEAISMVPNPELESNTVMDVVQKGYTLYGRVIRAAMVVVSQ